MGTNLAELNALATKITGQTVNEDTIVKALNKIAAYYKGAAVAKATNAEALAEIEDNYSAGGGADIQANKNVTITTNTVTEVTPDDGKDGMAKVTVTTAIPVPTPPEWFDDGMDSVPPQEGTNNIVFADENTVFDGMDSNHLAPDGESTIAELIAGMLIGYTIDSVEYSGTVPSSNGSIDIFSSTSHSTEP